jgi:uncharacterized OB-fold protein
MDQIAVPLRNALNAPFWAAAERGVLALPHCLASGRAFWPPSPLSPHVTAGAVAWRETEPVGVLRSLVVYRRVFLKAFEAVTPFGVGLLELDAGPRLLVHVPHPDDPTSPAVGERAILYFAPITDGGPPVPTLIRST